MSNFLVRLGFLKNAIRKKIKVMATSFLDLVQKCFDLEGNIYYVTLRCFLGNIKEEYDYVPEI